MDGPYCRTYCEINQGSKLIDFFKTCKYEAGSDRYKKTTNQNSIFRSRDWLSANQGPVFQTLPFYWPSRYDDALITNYSPLPILALTTTFGNCGGQCACLAGACDLYYDYSSCTTVG